LEESDSTGNKISRRDFIGLIGASIIFLTVGGLRNLPGILNKNWQSSNAAFGQTTPNPGTDGVWDPFPNESPVLPIHAALLRTGRVLLIGGSQNDPTNFSCKKFRNVVWDPRSPEIFKVMDCPPDREPSTDIFCCGHSFLSDGRLLIAGGTSVFNFNKHDKEIWGGSRDTYVFDPVLQIFQRKLHMKDERWYPTLVSLANGNIFTISGWDEKQEVSRIAEVYSDSQERWTAMSVGNLVWPLYPHIFLMQNGRLFYSGGHTFGVGYEHPDKPFLPGWIDIASDRFDYTPLSSAVIPSDFFNSLHRRDQCCSVLLPPAQEQKIMIIGGGNQGAGDPKTPHHLMHLNKLAISDVHIIDLSVPNGRIVRTGSLNVPRLHHNAVLLPDRTVFVCHGNLEGEVMQPEFQQNISEIYNPANGNWKMVARAQIPRLYHSVALLLPDGRVVAAGSNPDRAPEQSCIQRASPEIPKEMNGKRLNNEFRLEIYSPPYLFHLPRPVIEGVQQQLIYGGTIDITTSQAQDIIWIHLVRPMATTHSTDTEQRLVDLPFLRTQSSQLTAVIPNNPNLAPPGWYMLFVVRPLSDRGIPRGVPSDAVWVHLGSFAQLIGKMQHIAGVDSNQSVIEFRWSPSSNWHMVDVSAVVRGNKITGSLSTYVAGNNEHIAGIGRDGHVYLYFRSLAHNWNFIDVTVDAARRTAAGNVVGNVVEGTLTSYTSGNNQYISGVGRDGHVYLFYYIPNVRYWQFIDVTVDAARRTAAGNVVGNVIGQLTSYTSGNNQYISGVGRDGHVYLFYYIPNVRYWQFIDVTVDAARRTAAGNVVGNVVEGTLTSYTSGNNQYISVVGRDGHVYLFYYIPSTNSANPANWRFIDISVISNSRRMISSPLAKWVN
jgi:hypothetical protein